MAHRASRRRSSRCKERVYQCAERADGVHTRLAGAAQNKHLDGAKLAQGHIQVKILVERGNRRVQKALQLLEAQTGDSQGAHRGNKDLPISIHGHARIQIDLSPHMNEQLVARPNHVICWNRNPVKRRKGCGSFIEQLSAENLQRMASLVLSENLELRLRGNGANWFVGWWNVRRGSGSES